MAAHRYWRLVGFATYGGGALELSEVQLFAAGVQVGGAVVPSCPADASTGALSDLSDGATTSVVSWPRWSYAQGGFYLAWDLTGSGADVEALKLGAGSSRASFPAGVTLQYSDNAAKWSTAATTHGIIYPGAMQLTAAGAGADPYKSSVSALLSMDGEDGRTTFFDESGKTWTATGGTVISTGSYAKGNASGLFNGTGGVGTTTHADFGFGGGDYTVEGWINQGAETADRCLFDNRTGGAAGVALYSSALASDQTNRLIMTNNVAVIAGGGSTTFTPGVWQHWAISKIGTTARAFIGGGKVWTVTDSRTLAASAGFVIGSAGGGQNFLGRLDDVRITKGVGRYTDSFIPPVDAFGTIEILPVQNAPATYKGPIARAVNLVGSPRPAGAASPVIRTRVFADVYNGGWGVVSGTVKQKNTPINTPLRRRVVLIDEQSRATIRETWSDAVTGNYEFRGIKLGVPYTVMAYDYTGAEFPVVADRQYAEALVF